jgi:hypothetical protein
MSFGPYENQVGFFTSFHPLGILYAAKGVKGLFSDGLLLPNVICLYKLKNLSMTAIIFSIKTFKSRIRSNP